jgi:tetratricopeptide (TPR) repeat protein
MIQTIIGIVIAFFIALYFFKKGASKKDISDLQEKVATKKDVKKVEQEIKYTRKELQLFKNGFAENTSSDESLKGKMEEADALFHEGKFKEAYKLHDEINKKALSLGKDKLFVLSLMGKGISIGMQADHQKALEILRNAEGYEDFLDDNAKGKLYFNLGYCNSMLNNYALSIEYYSRSIDCTPNIAETYRERGYNYGNLSKRKRAIEDFNKAIELDPGYAYTYIIRGLNYSLIQEHRQAIRNYDTAIEVDPEYTYAYYIRAATYLITGKHEQAIRDLNKAIEIKPKNAYDYYIRGIAYNGIGKNKRAIDSFKKFIKLAPDKDKETIQNAKMAIEDLQETIEKNTEKK